MARSQRVKDEVRYCIWLVVDGMEVRGREGSDGRGAGKRGEQWQ